MGTWVRNRLTYGNVMASIAVFIALGAGAYAAGLAPNSVKSKHIVNGQVKEPDLADGAVTTGKLADDAVTTDKIQNGTVSDADLASRDDVHTPTLNDCATSTPWNSPVAFAIQAGYWKDRSGVVHLQGSIGCSGGNATEGAAIFTLPSGYRPAGIVRWGALSNNAAISQIAVIDNGDVVYDGPTSDSNDNYVSLDGLTFRAEQ